MDDVVPLGKLVSLTAISICASFSRETRKATVLFLQWLCLSKLFAKILLAPFHVQFVCHFCYAFYNDKHRWELDVWRLAKESSFSVSCGK